MDAILTTPNELHDFFQTIAPTIYFFRTPHAKSNQVDRENHSKEQWLVSIVERAIDKDVLFERSGRLFHV